MPEFGMPAFIREGNCYTKKRGCRPSGLASSTSARPSSISAEELERRSAVIDWSEQPVGDMQKVEEHKHGRLVVKYQKNN
jgi:hypothetical protein